MNWRHEHMKMWVTNQEFKIHSAGDDTYICQVEGMETESKAWRIRAAQEGRPLLGLNRQQEAGMKRLALDSGRLEFKSWCRQTLAV